MINVTRWGPSRVGQDPGVPPDDPAQPPAGRPARAARRPAPWAEVLLLVGFLAAYESVQRFAGGDLGAALARARDLRDAEEALGLAPERALDHLVSGSRWAALAAASWYQALHLTVTPAVLALALWRLPDRYRGVRSAFVAMTALALVGYFALPTAPPRLLAGYPDVVAAAAADGWWAALPAPGTAGAPAGVDQLAAMPSMHVGWAVWCALVLRQLVSARWARCLVALYPVTTALVVLGTGNHWLVDVVAGAGLAGGAWVLLVVRPEREDDGSPHRVGALASTRP